MENNFNELHTEICTKAKEKKACADQYKRALSSKTEAELLSVISDNLGWCIEHEIVSHELFFPLHAAILFRIRNCKRWQR